MKNRHQILKLKKGISTKSERRFLEILKENRTPFKSKVKLGGYEIDFLVGKFAVDIDCHDQSSEKNKKILELGYIPIHIHNEELKNNREIIYDWNKSFFDKNINS